MSDRRLRLLTANLLNGRGDGALLARIVEEQRVDVLACQELAPDQAAVLSAALPHGKLEPQTDHDGMGLALRHPGEVSRLPLRHRDARVATLRPGDWPSLAEPLEVVNVHLQAPHTPTPWTAFGRRRDQVAALDHYRRTEGAGRRILLGDFNATPSWPAYRRLATDLDDAARSHADREGDRPPRTWGPLPGWPRLLRIDHVLVPGFTVHRTRTFDVGSDHDALLVEISV